MKENIYTISERIEELVKFYSSGNNSDFANKINTSEANIRNYINGTQPKFLIISKIAETFEINYEWLLTGRGEMFSDGMVQEPRAVYRLRTDNDKEVQRIPLYSMEASAGLIPLFENHNSQKTDEYLSIPRVPKCDGAIFITGDSMYPLLKSGDIVAYKQINDFSSEIFWGEMYLISVEVAGEEYVSVKYVQKSDKGEKYIKLVSENRHHQAKDVSLQKVRAMALIKASVRINSMG